MWLENIPGPKYMEGGLKNPVPYVGGTKFQGTCVGVRLRL